MENSDLDLKIKRLYASIKATEESDTKKFPAEMIDDGRIKGFSQDWSGGLNEAEFTNMAYSLIYNIAHFDASLKKWAFQNGQDKTKVDDIFNRSLALRIIKDLSNSDKHGYAKKNGGHSGKSPRINEIKRVMEMTTKPKKNSFIALTFTPHGVPTISGDGTAKVILTGDILDGEGNLLGDLYKTMLEAVESWETLLTNFGLKL